MSKQQTTDEQLKERVEMARLQGEKDFNDGMPFNPRYGCRDLVKGFSVMQGLSIIDAWTAAWHKANIESV